MSTRWVLTTKRQKWDTVTLAIRDEEQRVRFSGYDVANFKIFILCFSAGFISHYKQMFTLQVGFMSPSFVGIVSSIEMVIFCVVGGRLSIFGAIYGCLIVNYAKTAVSENFPELWLFAMGALFIGVVMFFPRGSRLISRLHQPIFNELFKWLLTPENEESAKKTPLAQKAFAKCMNKISQKRGAYNE